MYSHQLCICLKISIFLELHPGCCVVDSEQTALFSLLTGWKCVESMGYDIERFVGYVNEGLLCSICRDVLEDPLQAPCEHAFCTACIHGWLVHHSNCPEDRQVIDVSVLRPLYRYTVVSLYVRIV